MGILRKTKHVIVDEMPSTLLAKIEQALKFQTIRTAQELSEEVISQLMRRIIRLRIPFLPYDVNLFLYTEKGLVALGYKRHNLGRADQIRVAGTKDAEKEDPDYAFSVARVRGQKIMKRLEHDLFVSPEELALEARAIGPVSMQALIKDSKGSLQSYENWFVREAKKYVK